MLKALTAPKSIHAVAYVFFLVSLPSCQKDDTRVAGEAPPLASVFLDPTVAQASSAGSAAAASAPAAQPVLTPFSKVEPPAVRNPEPNEGCSVDLVGDREGAEVTPVKRGEVHLIGWAAHVAAKT